MERRSVSCLPRCWLLILATFSLALAQQPLDFQRVVEPDFSHNHPNALNILFVGNSFIFRGKSDVYARHMLAEAWGVDPNELNIGVYTVHGHKLWDHVQDSAVEDNALHRMLVDPTRNHSWDVVVLQEYSLYAELGEKSERFQNSYRSLKALVLMAQRKGAKSIFLMATWAYKKKPGDENQNAEISALTNKSYMDMYMDLQDGVRSWADRLQVEIPGLPVYIAPVGSAFYKIYSDSNRGKQLTEGNFDFRRLYNTDKKHSSAAHGGYLVALVLASSATGRSSVGCSFHFNFTLSIQDQFAQQYLQKVSDYAVFCSSSMPNNMGRFPWMTQKKVPVGSMCDEPAVHPVCEQ